ncbi:MFS transporter [Haloechinothrix sp. YIM 98757]|uniref:MFS transporter n=1 Tax=Haloechinothrix aidingensis TaxID=2752311 RepID=A0A838AEH0_9PSEU|nr:MFS transporter [Haloechinothrix aidingensis]
MTTTPPRTQPAPQDEWYSPLTHKQILSILSGLLMGMFLAALDNTILSTAIRTIADDLQGLSMQAWATTAYLITATIATPIYGKLSDIYGRKPLFLTAITVFLVGSLACTLAQSMYSLAAFRALQGLGGGGLMSLAITIIGDIVAPRKRAKYQGYIVAMFALASVLGPVIGGLFAGMDTFAGIAGWRWVFGINVPIGIAALFVVFKVLNVPHERQRHRIDWRGAVFLACSVFPLLLVAEQGREWGWGSIPALACYAMVAIGITLFLWVEHRMGDAALIPMRLFRSSTFSVAIAASILIGVGLFGSVTLIPQYLQIVHGYSPTQAGLLTVPMMLGIMTGTTITGRVIAATGRYKILPVTGTACIALGSLLFAQVSWDSPLWHPLTAMAVIGFGLGGCMQTLVITAQNAGPRRDMGVSTASATFFRQIGGTLGVAVFLSILFSTLTHNIHNAAARLGMGPGELANGDVDIMRDSSFLKDLPVEQAQPFLMGFSESVSLVFYVAAGVAVTAFVLLLFMRELPLADSGSGSSDDHRSEAPHER